MLKKKTRSILRLIIDVATPLLEWVFRRESVARVYWNLRTDGLIRKYRTGAQAQDAYPIFRVYLEKYSPVRLLDIGCGSGRLFPLFAELNVPEIVGIDISSAAIKEIRPSPNCRVEVMTVEDLSFPPDYFDAAISNAVLRYVPHGANIARAISNIAEQCKSVLPREPIRGKDSYYNFIHDYEALFQGKMRLVEHYEDGPVDVMIFKK
ncbi:class I SAM-dependent methyltransferase [Chloroflexota bacterium]